MRHGGLGLDKLLRACGVLFSISLLAAGCINPSYQVASDDPCGTERNELKSIEQQYFVAAAAGALIGAAGGYLVGRAVGGDNKSGAIGAGVGAVAGGLGGYYAAKYQANNGEQPKVAKAISTDIAHENEQVDRISVGFRKAKECRLNAAKQVRGDLRAGRLDRPTAQARLERQRNLFQEDIAFAEGLGAKLNERGNEFRFAADQLASGEPPQQAPQQQAQQSTPPKAERPRQPAKRRPPPPPEVAAVAQLSETNQVKLKALNSEIASSKAIAASAFEIDGQVSEPAPLRRAAPAHA